MAASRRDTLVVISRLEQFMSLPMVLSRTRRSSEVTMFEICTQKAQVERFFCNFSFKKYIKLEVGPFWLVGQ